MRFELWSYDEFGQGSILSSNKNLDEVIKAAEKAATDENVENSLGMDDKNASWEVYFPVVFEKDKPSKKVLYAGDRKNGTQAVWTLNKNKEWEWKEMPKDTDVRIFLGNIPSSMKKKESDPWWLKDAKGKVVNRIDNPLLHRKTILFIKVI